MPRRREATHPVVGTARCELVVVTGPVTLAVVGAGSRGAVYASFARAQPDRARVVAVAEPRHDRRRALLAAHGLEDSAPSAFERWEQLVDGPRLADVAVIATQDRDHVAAAEALAAAGYHLLLEKPMAVDADGCRRIVAAVERAGVLLAVAHVLRYTPYGRALQGIVDDGRIGELVSIQHLEPVGWWHFAHSYVRGSWRREDEASPMLLAKSCHDLDLLRAWAGRPAVAVSSFGGLHHFTAADRPEGAADRCLDCAVEPDCPYSASRLYLGMVEAGWTGWPVDVVALDPTVGSVTEALRTGPYGRCVYACDNDVADHQVVAVEFERGLTAAFTVTAFTTLGPRRTVLFGTRGQVVGDGVDLRISDFATGTTERVSPGERTTDGVIDMHGGGDAALVDAVVTAVATGDPAHILSGPTETLESHLLVFAAEQARRDGRVVDLTRP